MEEFVAALKKPRIAMMMIKAASRVTLLSVNSAVTRARRRADRRRKILFSPNTTARQRAGRDGIHFVGMAFREVKKAR